MCLYLLGPYLCELCSCWSRVKHVISCSRTLCTVTEDRYNLDVMQVRECFCNMVLFLCRLD